nr:MAG TPA: hypothetical protein [Microviridae sp.]
MFIFSKKIRKCTVLLYQLRGVGMPYYFRVFTIYIVHIFKKNFSASRKV